MQYLDPLPWLHRALLLLFAQSRNEIIVAYTFITYNIWEKMKYETFILGKKEVIVQNVLVRMFSKYRCRLQRALVLRNVLQQVNGQLESLMMVKDNNVGACLHPLLVLFASWIVAENKNMMCVVIYYYRQTYSCSLANFKGKNEQIILQIDLRNIECFFCKSCFLNLWNLSSQTNCNA